MPDFAAKARGIAVDLNVVAEWMDDWMPGDSDPDQQSWYRHNIRSLKRAGNALPALAAAMAGVLEHDRHYTILAVDLKTECKEALDAVLRTTSRHRQSERR